MRHIIYIICCIVCLFFNFTNVAKAHTLPASDELLSLDGKWVFYHEQLMAKGTFEHGQSVNIPSSFETQIGQKNTYGTYVKKWHVPREWKNHKVAVHIPYEYSAYAFYVDGKKLAGAGTVGGPRIHETMLQGSTAYFTPTKNTVVFAMEVSSFHHVRGGFENSIKVSHAEAVNRYIHSQTFRHTILTGVIFMMGIMMLLFARYGGEEFIIVVKQPQEMTKLLAEHLRQVVEEANIPHLGRELGIVTASFGVATYTNEDQSRALIDLADSRLYEAKAYGRNYVY